MPTITTTVRLDVALVRGMQRLHAETGCPASETIRRAIAAYLAEKGIDVHGKTPGTKKRRTTKEKKR